MKAEIYIKSAKYFEDYKIEISFSDGHINIFDYKTLVMSDHEEFKQYRDIKKFKKFSIIKDKDIAWGKNWEMILPAETLYSRKRINYNNRKRQKKIVAEVKKSGC